MTIFLLLRHAHSTANDAGILAGRTDGIHLSTKGIQQSKGLPKALQEIPINRFISSSLPRCIETIQPTLTQRHKRLVTDDSFIEMDYGAWSGRELKKLRKEKGWKQVQRSPMTFTFPQGESFARTATRIERGLQNLSKLYPKDTILIVTHGDIIKLATQITLGGDLNKFQRLIVDTCSLTVLDWKKNERSLLHFNQKLVKIRRSGTQKSGMRSRRVLGEAQVSRQIYNLDQVDRFVLGTVGQPGERAFYLQVRKAGQVFSFALEKSQAQALTERFAEILKDTRMTQGAVERDTEPLDAPIDSEFTLGVMAITWQADSQLIRFEAQGISNEASDEVFEEIVGDDVESAPAILRLTLTPSQVRGFVPRSLSVIKAGRQPCMFCGGPINPDGHICPRAN